MSHHDASPPQAPLDLTTFRHKIASYGHYGQEEAKRDVGTLIAEIERLREELAPLRPAEGPQYAERFESCVHCGTTSKQFICPKCGRERDSGIRPPDHPSRRPAEGPETPESGKS